MKNYYEFRGRGLQLGYQTTTITFWTKKNKSWHLWRGSVLCWFKNHKKDMKFSTRINFCKRCARRPIFVSKSTRY